MNLILSAVQASITVNITPYTLITIMISLRITSSFTNYLPILAYNSLADLITITLRDLINYYKISRIRAIERAICMHSRNLQEKF